MGKVRRRRFLNRGLWLHARVIPVAFPSGKIGRISGAMDVNLEWTRISDDRRPRAWKQGSPEPGRGNQFEEPDATATPTPVSDARRLQGMRHPSPSPRGLTPGRNRNWAVGPEPK